METLPNTNQTKPEESQQHTSLLVTSGDMRFTIDMPASTQELEESVPTQPDTHEESVTLNELDRGSIDIAEAQVAYHGLAYSILRHREERAKERASNAQVKAIEKREDASRAHDKVQIAEEKQWRYEDLSNDSRARVGGPSSNTKTKPQGYFERKADKRMVRRETKKAHHDAKKSLYNQGYATDGSDGALTKKEKRREKRAIKKSDNTAMTKKVMLAELKTKRTIKKNRGQKAIAKGSKRIDRSHNRSTSMPIATRLRNVRKSLAERKVQRKLRAEASQYRKANRLQRKAARLHTKAQTHLDKAVDISW